MLEDSCDSTVPSKECTENTQIPCYGARNPEEWTCSAGHWHPVRSVIYTTKIFWLTSWLMGLLFMWFYWWKWARKTKREWRVHFQTVVQPWNLLPRNVNVRTHSHLSPYKNQRHCFRPCRSFGQLGVKESNVQTCENLQIHYFLHWVSYLFPTLAQGLRLSHDRMWTIYAFS